ncbi:MAG: Hsp20/alpha crystallin family protein [Erysipelotrichaceae bacterium]|nr:Hsp20/alpha crystallin family protein [Erysipelotrichaceae bacterium]
MFYIKKNDEGRNTLLDEFNNFFSGGLFYKEMKTDIEETENEYKVSVDVPGVDKKDIQLSYEENVLSITINHSIENEDKNRSYIKRERSVSQMSRSYYLENGDENKIKAKLNDGVLEITIGKSEIISNKKTISID